jgi:hypothetical protein
MGTNGDFWRLTPYGPTVTRCSQLLQTSAMPNRKYRHRDKISDARGGNERGRSKSREGHKARRRRERTTLTGPSHTYSNASAPQRSACLFPGSLLCTDGYSCAPFSTTKILGTSGCVAILQWLLRSGCETSQTQWASITINCKFKITPRRSRECRKSGPERA